MSISLERHDDVFILTPGKEGLSDQAVQEIDAVPGVSFQSMYSADAKAIIVDLKNIDFLDSQGFGLLAGIRSASAEGCALICCGMSGAVKDMMTITRLKDLAKLYLDREEALAALR